MSERDLVSVVIPIFDEAENVGPLTAALIPALNALGRPYEVIFIDDGSTDGTSEALAAAARTNAHVRVITFKRNFGQTAAMMAGIDHARGAVIVPMDGDLQTLVRSLGRLPGEPADEPKTDPGIIAGSPIGVQLGPEDEDVDEDSARDHERAEALLARVKADPSDDAAVDELVDLLGRLGRDDELFALLSGRWEDATPEDCAAGANVLLHTVLSLAKVC